MSNFSFLAKNDEYKLFSPAALEAERVYAASPAMCAVGCRKALELAVKWVYAADDTMRMPYKNNLQSLIHEPSFRLAVPEDTWDKLPFVIKLGNLAVHTAKSVVAKDALLSLRALFEFVQWLDYCYGADYKERDFAEGNIPAEKMKVDIAAISEKDVLLAQKEQEIQRLLRQIEKLSPQYAKDKAEHERTRSFAPEEISEYETRKRYIDVDLKLMGWDMSPDGDVLEEYPLTGMMGRSDQQGRADYVLMGDDGLPLAVVEAKRTGKDVLIGREQARLYADCLEKKFGRRPMMFLTNGFETYFWDDVSSAPRRVSSVFGKRDLQKLMNRRSQKSELNKIPISDRITDRVYQKEAIRAVCGQIEQGFRRSLLVMATGTGKTRTAASLVDVLSRGGRITNVLFLADRTALVQQARDDFKQHLPDMSLCNLTSNKDDRSARIVFSTYPTMLNAIDECKSKDGYRLFTPAHFDLIIIDESHRSIFKKYRAIFDYFDALLVGLTATPKTEVARNTYEFFNLPDGVPTYAYDYETAVYKDHVLVPFKPISVKTKFMDEGIVYDKLSAADKERFEEDFVEDGSALPSYIPSRKLNKFVFNIGTVDMVVQDLMEKGIHVQGGDRIGKSIVFAQNKKHAQLIVDRFNELYPQYKGKIAARITCEDKYAQSLIDEFKQADKPPYVAVSVDMMDTGIDVPECVNLVFFKKVCSKTKFWQMIGRGTRLCPSLDCVQGDEEYAGKREFLIFDYCGNFEFFNQPVSNEEKGTAVKSLSESIFCRKIALIFALQSAGGADNGELRRALAAECCSQVKALNGELTAVKLQRRWVEKYRRSEAFDDLSQGDKGELMDHIAPLVFSDDDDEAAKRFDNFIYKLMLDSLSGAPASSGRMSLVQTADSLLRKVNIAKVKQQEAFLKSVSDESMLQDMNVSILEEIRQKLRGLIKFIASKGSERVIFTDLHDVVKEEKEVYAVQPSVNLQDYRSKVSRYVEEHMNDPAIYKLRHNVPLTAADMAELERVFTEELGSRDDYRRTFGQAPLGIMVRRIAKLDRAAAMKVFSEFINDENLNQQQIAFVNMIIDYIEQNGSIEDKSILIKAPFDKPGRIQDLFGVDEIVKMSNLLNGLHDNAVTPVS